MGFRFLIISLFYLVLLTEKAECDCESTINDDVSACFDQVKTPIPTITFSDLKGDFSSFMTLANKTTCSSPYLEQLTSALKCLVSTAVECQHFLNIIATPERLEEGFNFACSNLNSVHDSCVKKAGDNIATCYREGENAIALSGESPSEEQQAQFICGLQEYRHNCTVQNTITCDLKSTYVKAMDYFLSANCVGKSAGNDVKVALPLLWSILQITVISLHLNTVTK